MKNFIALSFSFCLVALLGCESEPNKTTQPVDCRTDGVGCGDTLDCLADDDGQYTCQPEAGASRYQPTMLSAGMMMDSPRGGSPMTALEGGSNAATTGGSAATATGGSPIGGDIGALDDDLPLGGAVEGGASAGGGAEGESPRPSGGADTSMMGGRQSGGMDHDAAPVERIEGTLGNKPI